MLTAKVDEWAVALKKRTGLPIESKQLLDALREALSWVTDLLPQLAGAAIRILVGLIIMIVALYYFFADGPAMINGLMGLSPMDRRHELELLARFAEISRSVVVATLLSAIVQGILAGIGFYFALPTGAPIFLLIALTMVLAIVPFIGAAGVWVPACAIIFLFGQNVFVVGGEAVEGGNWKVAAALAVYCAVAVSGIDNVIKPLVLHGQANLHPLLALLSILGGIQVLGPVGILVGPMLVSFLQALLAMFRKELERWEDPTQRSLSLSPGARALAEQIEAAVEATEAAEPEEVPVPSKSKKAFGKKKRGPKRATFNFWGALVNRLRAFIGR
jgi:predicted PurR-regulated permease PerM